MHFSNPSNITLATKVYKISKTIKAEYKWKDGWVMANKGDTLERVR